MMLTEIGLFAGIGGFQVGFERAGIRTVALVEKDAACQTVLRRRFSGVPVLDDVRTAGAHNLPWANIVSFGFPCQDLSVAGNRAGLAGARSGLFYEATRIVHELQPDFAIWENVPGLLSSGGGRDFAAVLLELERIGYCGCWSTLDAQFFGLAQRRQRIFGVFARRDIGAARCAQILALTTRLPWNTPPRPQARARVAASLTAGTSSGRGVNPPGRRREDDVNIVAHTLTANYGKQIDSSDTNQGPPNLIAFAQNTRDEVRLQGGHGQIAGALGAQEGMKQRTYVAAIAATLNSGGNNGGFRTEPGEHLVAGTLAGSQLSRKSNSPDGNGAFIPVPMGVRRLTPTECERLQGFPDGWTEGQPDSTRYRQLGNAVAVPVARWIGAQIVQQSEF